MATQLVSIIMPAYNSERFIKQAIESVIAQTYPHWELLVINDGSTDATQAIVEEIALADARIKLINQQNKKLAGARNTGLKLVQGQWVALLDADDLWHEEKLQKQIEVITQNADIDLVYTTGWVFKDEDLNNLNPYPIVAGTISGADMYKTLYQFNTIPVLSVLFKSNLISKIGLQQEEVHCLEDWDYWLRMALAGATFHGLNIPLFYYRRHGQNMSASIINMHYAQAFIWLKNYRPQAIDKAVFRRAITSLLNFLLPLLIKEGQKDKARNLITLLKPRFTLYAKLYQTLINLSNGNTVVFFSLANRLYIKLLGKKQGSVKA